LFLPISNKTLLNRILSKPDMESLRQCISAGEALPAELYNRWKNLTDLEILDGIGSTEALHIFISNRHGEVKPGSSGRIVPGYEAKIVNENGIEVTTGEIGNLMIKGDCNAPYKHPRWIEFIESLPRTARGKVQRST
jgi:acyl-coenzyme A synthetase/AMP-(fatty) acid ligase